MTAYPAHVVRTPRTPTANDRMRPVAPGTTIAVDAVDGCRGRRVLTVDAVAGRRVLTVTLGALALAGVCSTACAQATQGSRADASASASLESLASRVSADELHATIERLVGFGTRHTLSDIQSETRGIGAARRWARARFEAIARECGGCLDIVTPSDTISGARVPKATEVVDVVGIQRGTDDPERMVLITGHLDSRVSDIMNATSDAPGANDDASGVAAVLEAARVLSKERFRATIVYGVLSGEEQGLFGGRILSDYAKANGWRVEAVLNNDIVGNSRGADGVHDNTTVRVFSEGTRATETAEQARRRRFTDGELDSPSRNVARYMASLAGRHLTNFKVALVYRVDRFGRGGDQIPFLDAGIPAVRITETHEDWTRQHQDLRTENGVRYGDTIDGVDFAYLAQVTRLNVVTLAALARAPAPPKGVATEGAVTPNTTVKWEAQQAGVARWRVWRRGTTDPHWRTSHEIAADAADAGRVQLRNVVIDDWFFGVSAVGADGYESPVVSAGETGAF